MQKLEVAVLIPCYNEATTIGDVVADFRAALPEARIYVYDNNSTDGTAAAAAAAGAVVRHEPEQGKGAVVRRMFRDVEADFYLMVDGDRTYDAACAPRMLALAQERLCDLVNCAREEADDGAYRAGHRLGNRMLTGAVRCIFGNRLHDMLSGYKLFSRRFVKSFPATSIGFGIETELAVHALELHMPIAHVAGPYRGRPAGSTSKLSTYRDGLRILLLILQLFKHERPLLFFSAIGAALVALSTALGIPLLQEYLRTGLVPRFPTAILATGIMLLGFLGFVTGLVLDTVTRGRRETKMLTYLNHPFPARHLE
ncbi:glycosyltransferase family 2 protein [Fulvimonas soli]|jgi:glycosyltransferase involved in cell wall biosynthesis|uniref:Glycosyltransferase involved in cell wall biosynthesis n=1 Tax=Fulvimonas soli TaxID=155197 RepID=A0A316HXK0_9GAMM|nr:glycosyltransferase family 2 protein [Fulvimonas soli]PWK84714.1 glycosyltransferase involved in cell wall biosynthesis [Fulvimonas soli]TNY26347.1 glycosyl transferase [Fulvimonas soli]